MPARLLAQHERSRRGCRGGVGVVPCSAYFLAATAIHDPACPGRADVGVPLVAGGADAAPEEVVEQVADQLVLADSGARIVVIGLLELVLDVFQFAPPRRSMLFVAVTPPSGWALLSADCEPLVVVERTT